MPSVFSKFQSGTTATVDQELNSKPPYMCAGDLSLQTCVDWECACKHYANNKDIPANKIVKHTLDGFEDVCFVNWLELDHERFKATTLDDCRQSINALLKNTPHHLDEDKLQERIEAGMNQVLYVQVTNVKLNLVKDFCKWLAAVKSLDDEKHFQCDRAIKAFEQSTAGSCASSHDANTQTLSGPSHKTNAIATAPTTTAIATPKADYPPPKLTDDEKCLLLKYNGCLKCWKPFVYHKGSNKASGCSFLVGAGYKPLTQAAIMTAMLAGYKPAIASVVPSSLSIHPIAAVFPGIANPVDYLATNASRILSEGDPDSSS
ncbi:hypothetical protein PILCRDRAFT_92342 [Piloderma croceum F 1598]|uniref:Uncharacterized protein n=1 Tax=Piloderma croceum (strain F 1598) TaxID=765440 RepID=A0A0C3BCI9_PILCF|nr:hypothetical protein PILCRDRAFT_92342 [Piloderma croceum F 1598]